jgi:hypothetical protein
MNASRTAAFAALTAAATLLSACGGGGGGPEGPTGPTGPAVAAGTVSYADSTLLGLAFDDETGRAGFFWFTIDPAPSTPPVVDLLDGGGLFTVGRFPVGSFQGSYVAEFPIPDGAAAGDHTGAVTVRICGDDTCASAFALPQPTMPYDVTIYHVETGLPPLDATLTLDGAAATGVTEGLDGAGARTYAVPVHVGQVLGIEPSVASVVSYRGARGDTATLARLPSTYPLMRYQASLPVGAVSGVGSLKFRVPDGRWLYVTLNVTP